MKRTKKITATLKAISNGLPGQNYSYHGRISEKGDQILQRGVDKDGDGLPVLPNKEYIRSVAMERKVNHFRRLKSAFDSNGLEGIKNYLGQFLKPEKKKEYFKELELLF